MDYKFVHKVLLPVILLYSQRFFSDLCYNVKTCHPLVDSEYVSVIIQSNSFIYDSPLETPATVCSQDCSSHYNIRLYYSDLNG